MKGLLKLAFLTGLGAAAWKGWKEWQSKEGAEDQRRAAFTPVRVRDAGPEEQHIDARDWDLVDEQNDESFPASDPPANYRGLH
ncbi:hypothetical protein NUH86_08490 [Sphingobium sp. JS3065]|jgi:uncharacterized membrane protein YebE (DUF533 family)|uniref:hypothetical protein n=1 Tax=Sphingobium sp. JS3065 TaxID=2970925 RepID=UPI00226437E1|nr:hypothetical protein [Sphingobium sp. JS3065]UZW53609.1 hypothetical protein NUH86_08490 [Sphingobium sp. JS3065]